MSVRTPRMGTWKPCLIDACRAMVMTCGNRKRCDDCRRAMWRDQATSKVKRGYVRYVRTVEPYQESSDAIEARFQAALKEAKRTVREPLCGWSSPLAGIR